MMRFRYIVIVILLLAVGAAAYFYFRPIPVVKVQTATSTSVAEFIYANGTVEPIQLAKVVPLQRRRIVELCRCEGQRVTKGQILGRQDDAEERAVLKELELRYEQLKRDRDRAKKDYDRGDIKKAQFEQQDTAAQEARSRVNAQLSRIETLVFHAPMDGMVLRRDGEVGEIAAPTDVLFWVGKPAPLQVVAEINEEEITKLKAGQTAFLSNEAFQDQRLRATVSHITPKGDPTKKTFRVYLTLPPNSPLRIGMSVEINIVFRQKSSAVVVPIDAVLNNAVQQVSDGLVRRVPVVTGIRGTQFVEIVRGVSAGAMVLSPARADIADDTRVQTKANDDGKSMVASKIGGSAETNNLADASRDTQASNIDNSADPIISATISAHVQSIIDDARRDFSKGQ
jgi:RND family efflux transporter MFP subunit